MLNAKELKIHNELLSACSKWKTSNQAIVVTLLAVARTKLFRKLKRRNLVECIVEESKIDSTFTFDLDRVVRSALEFPDLENALRDGSLTVSKAARILSALNPDDVRAIIAYAASHTYAETNAYLANQQPGQMTRETWKQLSADQYKVQLCSQPNNSRRYGEFSLLKPRSKSVQRWPTRWVAPLQNICGATIR